MLRKNIVEIIMVFAVFVASSSIYGAPKTSYSKKILFGALLASGINHLALASYCDSLQVKLQDGSLVGIDTKNCQDGDDTCLVWHRLGVCKTDSGTKTCEMRCAKKSDLDEESIVVSKASVYLDKQGDVVSVIADDIKDNGNYPCTSYKPWGNCQNITEIGSQINYGDIDSVLDSMFRCGATCTKYKNQDCFSANSFVYRKSKNGEKSMLRGNFDLGDFDLVKVAELKEGDYVVDSLDGSVASITKLNMISHELSHGIFYTLETVNGNLVTLSEHHRIKVLRCDTEENLEIGLVEPGDSILVENNWEEVNDKKQTNWFEDHKEARMFYTESGKILVMEKDGAPVEVLTCSTAYCNLEYAVQYLRLSSYARGMNKSYQWEDRILTTMLEMQSKS